MDVSTAELANGRMNRVTGLREIRDVKARCSTRRGALSLLGEAVERLPRCEEVARVRELVRTDWDPRDDERQEHGAVRHLGRSSMIV